MAILIINAGSSSVKFSLYDKQEKLLTGHIDRIGKNALLILQADGKKEHEKLNTKTHEQAGKYILNLLKDFDIKTVLHRVVHGGDNKKPLLITDASIKKLNKLVELAPLHMPKSLQIIELFKKHTSAKQIACFDTLFHQTLPNIANTYALPKSLIKKHKIKRYGFHGFAHKDLAEQTAKAMNKSFSKLNIISCQLGNGASVCAIKRGKSVETSMGYTPFEGLIMGTRSGSIDPAIPLLLCEHGMKPKKVLELLETKSGLLALAGKSDVRDLLKAKDKQSKFALQLFSHEVKKYIGAYTALLGKVDAIVLGGGVAHSPKMRKLILGQLEHLGIKLNSKTINSKDPAKISSGKIFVYVTQPDEERQMLCDHIKS